MRGETVTTVRGMEAFTFKSYLGGLGGDTIGGGIGNAQRRTIHTYIHTYLPTYVHTYVHTYIHAYIHTMPGYSARVRCGVCINAGTSL